jgi:aspartokinase/homoserine dehydrogenase 1
MKVLKFGGGCLRNPEYVMKVTKIVESEAKPLALVVSAIYGITDLLQKGILEAIRNEKKFRNASNH